MSIQRHAAAFALGAVVTAVSGFAAPASAHVTVTPTEATKGGYGRVAFRVPTASNTASTTKVEVVMPADAPVASVSTMPVPGWTVTIEKTKPNPPVDVQGSKITEAVSKITWTVSGGAGIKPAEFQEFPVSLGPLPNVNQMVFKTLQTYSDGSVVRWIEVPPANGGPEPDQPAPVLKLAAASASPSAAASSTPAASPGNNNSTALGLGITGLVAGLAGLVLGGLALAGTRREAASRAA